VDHKVEAKDDGDDDDTAKGENEESRKTRRRNQFPRPISKRNSLRAELRLYFQGVGPDRRVQGKHYHPAPESKFIRQRVQGVPSLSK
jgi:hypothetical protein